MMAMETKMEDAIEKTNVRYCLKCGKCTGSCPLARVNPEYSPRQTVERATLGHKRDILEGKGVWWCLTCRLCSERCPQDVHYPDFIRACRAEANSIGIEHLCAHGGMLVEVQRAMTLPGVKQNRLGWIPKDAKVSTRGGMLYFVGCLPYFDVIMDKVSPNSVAIGQSVVRILNKVGIIPAVMPNERCCGHDLLWTGDVETFTKLAKMNVEEIARTGAKTVILSCPEGYRTLKLDYAELFGKLPFEVLHTSELFSKLIDEGKMKFDESVDRKVVYHDPCRLGRHMGVYDAPRKVLSSIPGVQLKEMDRSKAEAMCCGVDAWMCNSNSKQMQLDRLKEAKMSGADLLVTTCPKCQIHFRCVMSEKLSKTVFPLPEEAKIEVMDLSELVAKGMGF